MPDLLFFPFRNDRHPVIRVCAENTQSPSLNICCRIVQGVLSLAQIFEECIRRLIYTLKFNQQLVILLDRINIIIRREYCKRHVHIATIGIFGVYHNLPYICPLFTIYVNQATVILVLFANRVCEMHHR